MKGILSTLDMPDFLMIPPAMLGATKLKLEASHHASVFKTRSRRPGTTASTLLEQTLGTHLFRNTKYFSLEARTPANISHLETPRDGIWSSKLMNSTKGSPGF